jgi:hypothetical protein
MSLSWHRVELSDAEIANNEHERILELFEKLFFHVGSPADVALLSASAPGKTLLYFSPATSEVIIRAVRAEPSGKPPGDAVLYAGHKDVLRRLRSGEL